MAVHKKVDDRERPGKEWDLKQRGSWGGEDPGGGELQARYREETGQTGREYHPCHQHPHHHGGTIHCYATPPTLCQALCHAVDI